MESAEQPSSISKVISGKLVQLGQRFYPSEAIFDIGMTRTSLRLLIDFLIDLLTNESFVRKEYGTNPGWITEAFTECKVPYEIIFNAYDRIFDAQQAPWTTNEGLCFLLQEIVALMENWFGKMQSFGAMK